MKALHRKLCQRVSIEAKAETQDPVTGAVGLTWSAGARTDIPADVYAMSGRELLASANIQAGLMTKITIRKRDDVSADMRVLCDGVLYEIKYVMPVEGERADYLQLYCESGVVNGN